MNKLKLINVGLKVFKVLVFAGALLVICLFIFLPKGKPIRIGGPILAIEDTELVKQISEILPKDDQVNFVDFTTDFEVPLSNGLAFLIVFLIVVVSAYFFYLLHLAQQVVKDIRSGHSFTMRNISRIKLLGILIAISLFGEKLLIKIGEWWFGNSFQFKGMKLLSEPKLDFYIVVIGVIIFALGVAFEQGLKLQEEQDLTI